MKYLSLFSGIGGFELGIHSVFPNAVCIGFSEIDKYAIQTYRKHYPEHNLLGSITEINPLLLPDFDMMVGGFPCQDLSIAKANRKGLGGERSGLFWDMLSILKLKNPKYFCFENVASMPKKDRDIITKELGVEPVMINAALVSAQSRKRLFWCNWNVKQPTDRGIFLRDVLESGEAIGGADKGMKSYCIDANYFKGGKKGTVNQSGKRLMIKDSPDRIGDIGGNGQGQRVYSVNGKSVALSANGGGLGAKTGLYALPHGYNKGGFVECDKYPTLHAQEPGNNHRIIEDMVIRKLTPIECERLQCFPDNWTDGVSNTQRYKQLGNAVNVDVIKHIMSELRMAK